MDRITPGNRPNRRPVMRQRWRDLLFMHWTCPVEALRPLIPEDLEIDTYEGQAYLGIVPFTMKHVRPIWTPSMPWLSFFHETNLRTYVHRQGQNPGVWFISLDAANPCSAILARMWFRLPYHWARMSLCKQPQGQITHKTHRRFQEASCEVIYEPKSPIRHAPLNTLEHFLIERYFLYAQSGSTLFQGHVHHTPYPVQDVKLVHWNQSLIKAAGINIEPPTPDCPPLVHYCQGVNVEIFGLERLPK